jgi:DNA/RNA-binding domain of Phe-tRNA-synthetase-like protein
MAADKTTFLLVGRDMKSLVDRGEVLRTFDLDRVQPPIVFRVGQPGEIYWGIGRGEIKIEGLPVFADQLGPFGSTTSDSERTMVQLETTKIMMVIISFLGAEGLDVALRRAAGALERYAAATGIETGVVA